MAGPRWRAAQRRVATTPSTASEMAGTARTRLVHAIAICSTAAAKPSVPSSHGRKRRGGGGLWWISSSALCSARILESQGLGLGGGGAQVHHMPRYTPNGRIIQILKGNLFTASLHPVRNWTVHTLWGCVCWNLVHHALAEANTRVN